VVARVVGQPQDATTTRVVRTVPVALQGWTAAATPARASPGGKTPRRATIPRYATAARVVCTVTSALQGRTALATPARASRAGGANPSRIKTATSQRGATATRVARTSFSVKRTVVITPARASRGGRTTRRATTPRDATLIPVARTSFSVPRTVVITPARASPAGGGKQYPRRIKTATSQGAVTTTRVARMESALQMPVNTRASAIVDIRGATKNALVRACSCLLSMCAPVPPPAPFT
jgi:hypothetical protein